MLYAAPTLYNKGDSILYTPMHIVIEDPGSKLYQFYDRRIDRQIFIWKISNRFRTSSENNTGLYAIYLYNGKGVTSRSLLIGLRQYLSLGGIPPNPNKGCDLIGDLTPCKQKQPLNLSAIQSFQVICFMV